MDGTDCKQISKATQKKYELARIRTWNLLIRSQTRYPLRHKPRVDNGIPLRLYTPDAHVWVTYFLYGGKFEPNVALCDRYALSHEHFVQMCVQYEWLGLSFVILIGYHSWENVVRDQHGWCTLIQKCIEWQ